MSNKFAAALKPKSQPPADPAAVPQEQPASVHARPSRKSTKHIGGYFDPTVSRQLREIALAEDSSVQALLGEAIDMLFQSRRKPTIASKSPKK
jgi:hypothetical protein